LASGFGVAGIDGPAESVAPPLIEIGLAHVDEKPRSPDPPPTVTLVVLPDNVSGAVGEQD
jgi:hypothetical protein